MSYTTQLLKKYSDAGIIQDNSKIDWKEAVGGIVVLVGTLLLVILFFSIL